jgi:DNA-directed RNA polymerase specialized sigma24 family protein
MRKEIPAATNPQNGQWNPWDDHHASRHRRPANPFEALMGCAPGDEPELSVAELAELREVLEDAIDQLTEKERWAFHEQIVSKTSLEKMGVPKTTAARWRDNAIQKLRLALADHPAVVAYLTRHDREDT